MNRTFRNLRIKEGYPTIKSLAEASGLQATLISMIENGHRTRVSDSTLERLANALRRTKQEIRTIIQTPKPARVKERLLSFFTWQKEKNVHENLNQHLSIKAKRTLDAIMDDPEAVLLFCSRGNLTPKEINEILESIADEEE